MAEVIRVLVPKVPEFKSYKKYLKQIDERKIYSNFGPLNNLLVERLAEYFGVSPENVCSVANATLGIQGLIETLHLSKENAEWFLPSWTFTATATALAKTGSMATFVDIDHEWRAKFPERAEYLIDVAPFGDSINLSRLGQRKAVIVDAAPSFDSLRKVNFGTAFPIAVVVSLHATKLLPAGEGGIVISNSESWISEFKRWTNFGMDTDRISTILGTNGKLSEFSSAVALASLDNWSITRERFLDLRQRALAISHLNDFLCAPADEKFLATPYWILRTKSQQQTSDIEHRFWENRIETRKWWAVGLHKMKAFSNFSKGNLEETERTSDRYLGLPFHFDLRNRDFARIESALADIAR